ncbi:hypothetical protein Leryth_024947 [Lithospermum erythrorhizon]|nr:hypothetical protein Leryth_024947 [Lithospermum erythrorhizon]
MRSLFPVFMSNKSKNGIFPLGRHHQLICQDVCNCHFFLLSGNNISKFQEFSATLESQDRNKHPPMTYQIESLVQCPLIQEQLAMFLFFVFYTKTHIPMQVNYHTKISLCKKHVLK